MSLILKGAVLGVLIAAAPGPMSLLCMRRALDRGWAVGCFSGLGIALADGFYAACAAFGLGAVFATVAALRVPLHVIGGLALCVLAAGMLRVPLRADVAKAEVGAPSPRNQRLTLPRAALTTFGLTIVNPGTILAFAGFYAGALPTGGVRPLDAALLVLGTFAGSLTWWIALSGVIAGTHHVLGPGAMRLVRLGSALGLAAFGVATLITR